MGDTSGASFAETRLDVATAIERVTSAITPLHLLEDVPLEQQQRFLSVKAGTLFDPIPRSDAFEVWRVKTRTEPSLQDPLIRARLESRIVDRCFNELLSKHIDWKFFVPPSE